MASAQFSTPQIISAEAEGASKVYAADIDGDGDLDVLSSSILDNKIAWYENEDGAATFGSEQVITVEAMKVDALHVSDLDGDGDLDVLSASRDDNKIAWYENFGAGNFGSQQIISTEAYVAQSVYAADIDGDGDQDVLSASRDDNKIAWYQNLGGIFGSQRIISIDAIWANRVLAKDIDGDGDIDVVSSSELDDKIAWYENTNGLGDFSDPQIISLSADAVRDVYVADIDRDGDLDVLSASSADDKIAWYENLGAGTFGPQNVISTQADFAQSVYAADIDGDGDLDVLSASINDSKVAWYENVDGQGQFGGQRVISAVAFGAIAVYAANLDGDEDLDVLSASSFDNKIAWYESFAGKGLVQFNVVDVASGFDQVYGPHAVHTTDVDGDGDQDVLSASYNDGKIAWYKNNGGVIGSQQVITTIASGARDVFAADIDGDGDQDVLSASDYDNSIRWYENFDGLGAYELVHVITTSANNAYAVFAADLDNDGDVDVLSASFEDDRVAWYENLDGKGTFGEQLNISKAAKGATDVIAYDLDGDGDQDVVSASAFDDKIAWYENLDGNGLFGQQRVISTNADLASSVHAADLDMDGDYDILSSSSGDHKIAWYKNLDGQGTFSAEKYVSTQAYRAFSVYAADLDSDGDLDIISGSRNDNKVAWYENEDGTLFGSEQIISSTAMGVRSITAADMDQDGDLDVLSASQEDHRIAWYENLSLFTNSLSSEEDGALPENHKLGAIYPNPFSQKANLELSVERAQHVRVAVYDAQGRLADVLHEGILIGNQPYVFQFEKRRLAGGLYLFRIEGEFFHATRKALLLP